MRALVIGHDHVGGTGLVGDVLVDAGWTTTRFTVVPEHRYRTPDIAVDYPDPAGADLVLTLGAPWPRAAIRSWTHREVAFLADAHARGVPVLGVCAGAQLLAEALGGATTPLPSARIGWYPVRPDDGVVPAGPWFQWHADRITVPSGVEVLATSDDGVEAFRSGSSLGVQFHPEMTVDLLDRWLELDPDAARDGLRESTARHARVDRVRRLLTGFGLVGR